MGKANLVLFWAIQSTALLAFAYPPTFDLLMLAALSHYLRWLDRFYAIPPILLATGLFIVGGWPALVYGFCVPTFTLAHSTFAINSINHLFGTRRFETPDNSRNNLWTTLLTLGEGWHNNHHRFQRAARNGFYWWEIDPTFWLVKILAALHLAHNIVPVPSRVYSEARGAFPETASATASSDRVLA